MPRLALGTDQTCEDGDILMKLARDALESADLPDLQSLFADEAVVSNSPLPVPEMPAVISWEDWMKKKGVTSRKISRQRTRPVTQIKHRYSKTTAVRVYLPDCCILY
jgi:hypothetical protein